VPKAYAEASSNQWHLVPPTPAALAARSVSDPITVRRVNRLPIVPGKLFSIPDASNVYPPTGDTNTMFIADDNGRFHPGYVNHGFTNGARFYYFATARDILARDGLVSTGLLATVCDRMPPPVPMGVSVVNDYSYDVVSHANQQALRVIWKQVTNTSDIVSNYWIYRWTSIPEMNALSGNISNNLIGIVNQLPGFKTNSFLDIGPTSPTTNNYGVTYWYTVRAGDCGACGQNLSGNSGPAYGVLRKRAGPPAPIATIDYNCPNPWVDYLGAFLVSTRTPDTNNYNFLVTCTRSNAQIAWAQFQLIQEVYIPGQGGLVFQTNDLGAQFYTPGNNLVTVPYSYPITNFVGFSIFNCRAGTYDGKISPWTGSPAIPNAATPLPDAKTLLEVDFSAHTILNRVSTGRDGQNSGPCRSHDPVDPGTGLITPINICLKPAVGSKEWRLYQRVDDGPLSLYASGAVTNGTAT
ncbi:MAG: hypothetical protein NTW03_16485, partial [Verrucomicrobia bacterium]|nr:hypothetical protein [Verrucomicrobiota bacterium]